MTSEPAAPPSARWRSSTRPPGFERHRGPRRGTVRLSLRLWRSGPSPAFELQDPRWRRHLYEIVLAQETADDVGRYVDPERLVADWDHLWLPRRSTLPGTAGSPSTGPSWSVALSSFQRRAAQLLLHHPRVGHFALAGDAATNVHDVIDRPTQDLDCFTTDNEAVEPFVPAAVEVLTEAAAK